MMFYVRFLIVISFLIVVSCGLDNKSLINPKLQNAIESYIKKCEIQSNNDSTFEETDIYMVYMDNSKDEGIEIQLFQNTYYLKENLDGYIKLGDNKVFFYNSDKTLIDISKLTKNGLEGIPDEDSEYAEQIFDPKVERLHYKNGILE